MKILFLLLTSCLIISCSSNTSRNNEIESIFDINKDSKQNIVNQIKYRNNKLSEITQEINNIENYNYKVLKRSEFELTNNRDNSSIQKYLEDNNKIINSYKLELNKLKKEIKILYKMLEDNND